jgi:F0F1-type ATP synthase assembly protein I
LVGAQADSIFVSSPVLHVVLVMITFIIVVVVVVISFERIEQREAPRATV